MGVLHPKEGANGERGKPGIRGRGSSKGGEGKMAMSLKDVNDILSIITSGERSLGRFTYF